MKEMHGVNPAEDFTNEQLKDSFKSLYHAVHHGEKDDEAHMTALWAYEQELMERGIDPSSLLKTA